jgi:hypothetical protein
VGGAEEERKTYRALLFTKSHGVAKIPRVRQKFRSHENFLAVFFTIWKKMNKKIPEIFNFFLTMEKLPVWTKAMFLRGC